MTIEILDTTITNDPETGDPLSRTVEIAVSDGQDTYRWFVGGLPLEGDLQPTLDRRESELWAAASVRAETFDVFGLRERAIIKALALVILDEINALRAAVIPALPARNEGQIRGAIKSKLRQIR